MELYLLRHAIAVERGTPGYPNDDRPLTEDGTAKMVRAAKGIAQVIGPPDLILTSPLIRARDTALIAAKALGSEDRVELCDLLRPAKYKRFKKILLAGHEPDLGVLASTLIGASRPVIEFKKGALCAIQLTSLPPREPGKLLWHLTPKQLRGLVKK